MIKKYFLKKLYTIVSIFVLSSSLTQPASAWLWRPFEIIKSFFNQNKANTSLPQNTTKTRKTNTKQPQKTVSAKPGLLSRFGSWIKSWLYAGLNSLAKLYVWLTYSEPKNQVQIDSPVLLPIIDQNNQTMVSTDRSKQITAQGTANTPTIPIQDDQQPEHQSIPANNQTAYDLPQSRPDSENNNKKELCAITGQPEVNSNIQHKFEKSQVDKINNDAEKIYKEISQAKKNLKRENNLLKFYWDYNKKNLTIEIRKKNDHKNKQASNRTLSLKDIDIAQNKDEVVKSIKDLIQSEFQPTTSIQQAKPEVIVQEPDSQNNLAASEHNLVARNFSEHVEKIQDKPQQSAAPIATPAENPADNTNTLSDSIVIVDKNSTCNEIALTTQQTFVFNAQRLTEHCCDYAKKEKIDANAYLLEAKQQVNRGGLYAFHVLSGYPERVPQASDQDLISSIEALMWYFYNEHLGKTFKGVGFEEGSFLLPKEFKSLFDKAGYNRTSSHAKDLMPGENKGIDVPQPLFQNKTSILAISLGNNTLSDYIFIKPENYGLSGAKNIFCHLWEFVVAQARKIEPIQKTFGMKADNDPSYKKERIPAAIKNEFKRVVTQACNICKTFNEETCLQLANIGIFKMYECIKLLIQELQNEITPSAKEAIEHLNNFIKKLHKSYDYLNVRIGEEVILPKELLMVSSYCYHLHSQNRNQDPFIAYALTLSQTLQLISEYKIKPDKKTLTSISKNLANLQKDGATIANALSDKSLALLKEYIQNITYITKYISEEDYRLNDLLLKTPFLEHSAQPALVKQIELEQKTDKACEMLYQTMKTAIVNLCQTGNNQLSAIKYEGERSDHAALKLKFDAINDESTGLKKVTEWRQVTRDNSKEIKKPIDALLKNIESTLNDAALKNKPTNELENLCDTLLNSWKKVSETVVVAAHELGFYTYQHQDLKKIVAQKATVLNECVQKRLQHYEQRAQESTNDMSNDKERKEKCATLIQKIKLEMEKKPSSFEHQTGFSFGSSEPLQQELERSLKTVQQELKQLYPEITETEPVNAHQLISELHKELPSKNDFVIVDLTASMSN